MATIVSRSGKGSALSHAEMDDNFVNLNNDKAETSATTSELNTLDGITATTSELNLLSGKTTLDPSFTSTSAMSINSAHGSLQEQNIMVVSGSMMVVSGLIYTSDNIGTNPTLSITVSGYTVGFGHGTCSGHDYGQATGVDGGYVAEAHNSDGFYVYPRLSDQTRHYVYFHAMFRV